MWKLCTRCFDVVLTRCAWINVFISAVLNFSGYWSGFRFLRSQASHDHFFGNNNHGDIHDLISVRKWKLSHLQQLSLMLNRMLENVGYSQFVFTLHIELNFFLVFLSRSSLTFSRHSPSEHCEFLLVVRVVVFLILDLEMSYPGKFVQDHCGFC